jgi:hypothetical protein
MHDINGRSTTPLGAESQSAEEIVLLFNLINAKMRKIKKLVLSPSSHTLDIQTMSSIFGGISMRSTSCSTTCGSRPNISIYDCNGDCMTREGQYVVCIGPTNQLWKYCD